MNWLARRLIWTIASAVLVIGVAIVIWDALPGIIKVLAIVGVAFGFIGILKK